MSAFRLRNMQDENYRATVAIASFLGTDVGAEQISQEPRHVPVLVSRSCILHSSGSSRCFRQPSSYRHCVVQYVPNLLALALNKLGVGQPPASFVPFTSCHVLETDGTACRVCPRGKVFTGLADSCIARVSKNHDVGPIAQRCRDVLRRDPALPDIAALPGPS